MHRAAFVAAPVATLVAIVFLSSVGSLSSLMLAPSPRGQGLVRLPLWGRKRAAACVFHALTSGELGD